MALPTLLQQTAITNEKEALSLLREQKDIMKKLSDSIISNQREYGSLKKDMVDLRKEFVLGMKGISEISKYLSGMKSDKIKERRMDTKENTSTNIFSALISKLVGKKDSVASKDFMELQTKLIEETKILKSIALDNMENIRFIKKSYEDKERAKERKLLAEAIAEAIGSDDKGGFLKGIVVPLLTGFGIALATLGSAIVSGIGGAITSALDVIKALILKSALTPDIDVNRRGGGPIAAPIPGTPDIDPNKKDDKTKPKPKPTSKIPVKDILLSGAGLLGKLAIPATIAAALLALYSAEETQYGTGENENASSPEDVGGSPSETGLPQAKEKVEAEKKARAMEEERLRQLSVNESEAETRRLQRQSDQAAITSTPDESEAETRRLQRQSDQAATRATQKEQDITDMMSAKMKEFISSLGVDTDSLGGSMVKMLNNLGTIDFGSGKEVNLMPNLGTTAAKIMEDLQADLLGAKDAAMGGGGSTQLNTVNNNTVGGSTMTVPADSSSVNTDPGFLRYLNNLLR